MTLRDQIINQLGGRLFTATFTKADGSIRKAYGQIIADERLTDDHPNVITFMDYSIAKETFEAAGKQANVRRMKLEAGTVYTIKSGKTIISNAS